MLILLHTWLRCQFIDQIMHAGQVERLVKELRNGRYGQQWAWKALRQSQKVLQMQIQMIRKEGLPTQEFEDANRNVPASWRDISRHNSLCYLMMGSPKLREMLPIIRELKVLKSVFVFWEGKGFLTRFLERQHRCCRPPISRRSRSIHFPGSRGLPPLVLKPALYYSQTLPPMTLPDQNSLAVPLPQQDNGSS
jgi:hypothetical protein